MLTIQQLTACLPQATTANIAKFYPVIIEACNEFLINTPNRLAAFIAQIGHESGFLRLVEENLNYSADGLLATFPKYFSKDDAAAFERHPEMIANRIYFSRMGNTEDGDGWKYRGRGLIQITGKYEYNKCGLVIKQDLVNNPDYLLTPEGAARSAAWFWSSNNLNALADIGDILNITKKINGGSIGLSDRIVMYNHCLQVLTEK